MKKFKYIVFIGRFQPPHLAHIKIIEQALERSAMVIVLIGSAGQPRTIKNPFTWTERLVMIQESLPHHLIDRIQYQPIYDMKYNDQQWLLQIQTVVNCATHNTLSSEIGIIGHTKDESSYYLDMFPQWDLLSVDNIEDIHATNVRNLLFGSQLVSDHLPKKIHSFIEAFQLTSDYEQLVREYEFIKKYKESWSHAPYALTFVTVDTVVIQSGHVLLVRRRAEPGLGLWALPGGFINPQERLVAAALRELREETKLKVPEPVLRGNIKHQEVYDDPGRSLRGRTITHAFLIELPPGKLPKVKGSDDAKKAKWVPLEIFARMADQMFEDHFCIINDMIGKL